MKRPNHFAYIWAAGDWLYLELPAINGLTAHTIRLPDSAYGLEAALRTLRTRDESSVLGTRGDPTQHNVDKLIADFKGKRKPRRKLTAEQAANAKAVLRNLGMIR